LKATIGNEGDDRKRRGKQLETMARQFNSKNDEENDDDDGNESETTRRDEETMGEKAKSNLIQEVSETGLYTSTGARNMLGTNRRKVRTTETTKLDHLRSDEEWSNIYAAKRPQSVGKMIGSSET